MDHNPRIYLCPTCRYKEQNNSGLLVWYYPDCLSPFYKKWNWMDPVWLSLCNGFLSIFAFACLKGNRQWDKMAPQAAYLFCYFSEPMGGSVDQ
jgi:hypothetical protein